MGQQDRGDRMGLPTRAFLYTLDQVADMLVMDLRTFRSLYIHYDRRTPGVHAYDKMIARNIAPPGEKPEWRIAEAEVIRWLKRKGFRLYDKNWITSN